jgi:hypothetical protein
MTQIRANAPLLKNLQIFPFFDDSYASSLRLKAREDLLRILSKHESSAERALALWMSSAAMAGLASSVESKPMTRAKIFLERALCIDIGFPVDLSLQESVKPSSRFPKTPRERFEVLNNVNACSSCHQLLNPIGFAFEKFDAVGQVRTSYVNDEPVEEAISVENIPGIKDGTYANVQEFLDAVGKSPQYLQCQVKQVYSAVTGDMPIQKDPLLKDAYIEFVMSGSDIFKLVDFYLNDKRVYLRGDSQ